MQIEAVTTGFGVSENSLQGTVEAIHPRAALLALADGTLVTLVPRAAGSLPFGVTLATPPGFSFERSLNAGVQFAARGGVLRFERAPLSIDLRTARPWRAGLASLALDLERAAVRRAWERAAAALVADGRAHAFVRLAEAALARLVAGADALDRRMATAAARALVGLGQGSTPAGDDVLAGFLAGLWCTARRGPKKTFLAGLATALEALGARTSRVSRVYLEAAAAGEVSERLAAVAARIAEGAAPRTVAAATRAALAVGHSSGADGVLGLLLGSAAFGPRAPSPASLLAELAGPRPAAGRAPATPASPRAG